MTNTITKKYRPSLTADDINHIISLAKKESPISIKSIDVLTKLAPFKAKIDVSSVDFGVGMIPTSSISNVTSSSPINDIVLVKEEYWERCHDKYLADPEDCTVREIKAAQEHRYINDLMSSAEIIDFEASESNP